jgi:hypothetical protein
MNASGTTKHVYLTREAEEGYTVWRLRTKMKLGKNKIRSATPTSKMAMRTRKQGAD